MVTIKFCSVQNNGQDIINGQVTISSSQRENVIKRLLAVGYVILKIED